MAWQQGYTQAYPSPFEQPRKMAASPAAAFLSPDRWTDVVFVVEGSKLHFNKTILSMCSPAFEAMFEADFKERTAKEIKLPGKKYLDMVMFFEHIHPKYSWKSIKDEDWEKLLILADEYQVEHIREKCEQHLQDKIELCEIRNKTICSLGRTEPDDHMAFYLLMCARYKLTKHVKKVMELVAKKSVQALDRDEHFQELSAEMQRDVFRLKCTF